MVVGLSYGVLPVSLSKLFSLTLSCILGHVCQVRGIAVLSLLTPGRRLLQELGSGLHRSAWIHLVHSGVWGILGFRSRTTPPRWLGDPVFHRSVHLSGVSPFCCLGVWAHRLLEVKRNICAFS